MLCGSHTLTPAAMPAQSPATTPLRRSTVMQWMFAGCKMCSSELVRALSPTMNSRLCSTRLTRPTAGTSPGSSCPTVFTRTCAKVPTPRCRTSHRPPGGQEGSCSPPCTNGAGKRAQERARASTRICVWAGATPTSRVASTPCPSWTSAPRAARK